VRRKFWLARWSVAFVCRVVCVFVYHLFAPYHSQLWSDLYQTSHTEKHWSRDYKRVCTDPGKVWKVLEFNVEIFKALKSLENDYRYGKVWKNP